MKKPASYFALRLAMILLVAAPVFGAQWKAKVGADTKDQARQALAFLPNEIWIHEGDSVT